MTRPTRICSSVLLALAALTAAGDVSAQETIEIQVPPGTSREEAIRIAREKAAALRKAAADRRAAAEAQDDSDTDNASEAEEKNADDKPADDKPAAKVESAKPATITVKAERLKLTLDVSGKFQSGESSEISLRPNAWSRMEVVEAVPHGTRVREGEVLVELDTEDLERAVDAAERELESAQLELEAAELSLELLEKTMPIDIAAAERRVSQAEADLAYYFDVTKGLSEKRAKESLEGSEYSLEYAQEELDQLRQMYEADDMTEQTEEIILKRAERAVKRSESSLESARVRTKKTLEVDMPRTEQTLRDATAKTTAAKKKTIAALEAGMRQAELSLEGKRLAVEAAERKLAELQEDLEVLSSITAPQAGYVYYGQFKNGSWGGKEKAEQVLKAGGTLPSKAVLMTIVSPSISGLETAVDEKDVSKLRTGLTGKGEAVAGPDLTFGVSVESITRVPIASGKFGCFFRCEDVPEMVVPGMAGKATLTTYDKADAILLPSAAVGGEDDDRFVTMADGSRREVTVGKTKGDKLEITRGLRPGDEVRAKADE